MWPMLNPHLFTVGCKGCLNAMLKEAVCLPAGLLHPDCCHLACPELVLPCKTWVLVFSRVAFVCLKHDDVWLATRHALLAIVCLVEFMVQHLRCCCGACRRPQSMIRASLLTVHALAAIVEPTQYRPLALPSCPFGDPGIPGAIAEAPCWTWTSMCTANLKPLPARHKRAAWRRYLQRVLAFGRLTYCRPPIGSLHVQTTDFGTCRPVGLAPVFEPPTRRLCVCRPLPAGQERTAGGPTS